jgi:hypothetical protein
MINAQKENPFNMTRVLVKTTDSIFTFAFYKDGMYQLECNKKWVLPKGIISWINIPDLRKQLNK